MSSRNDFAEMLAITGLTALEVIEIEKSAAAETLLTCENNNCTEEWHWCSNCDYHLDSDGSCMNCDF